MTELHEVMEEMEVRLWAGWVLLQVSSIHVIRSSTHINHHKFGFFYILSFKTKHDAVDDTDIDTDTDTYNEIQIKYTGT